MNGITATVIADSVSHEAKRLTTMLLRYPRIVHSEFMTHRVFARNASSSRAIPVRKMLSQVWNDPAMPVWWGWNRPGMQSVEELPKLRQKLSKAVWKTAGRAACVFAWVLMKLGNHKQVANRVLEPWQFITVVVTATEWENFFRLRCHPDADPTIQQLATKMQLALSASKPELIGEGEWHLPFVRVEEKYDVSIAMSDLPKLSTARCARTSYNNHDGSKPVIARDFELFDDLIEREPQHASPSEHQAMPDTRDSVGNWKHPELHGNLRGWIQFRKTIETFKG
ncbi:FAD-dependent thymidylate synthase [Methyloversatilis sp.]|uniref:FAD-dependent thymidylate synthase n=1 Tax=Methyloversatilis sp. TaxID=2569862 RepID=UPI0035B1C898